MYEEEVPVISDPPDIIIKKESRSSRISEEQIKRETEYMYNNQCSGLVDVTQAEEELVPVQSPSDSEFYKCPLCDIVLDSSSQFMEHKLWHEEPPGKIKMTMMRDCSVVLTRIEVELIADDAESEGTRNSTVKSTSATPTLPCSTCGLELRTNETFQRHLLQHQNMDEEEDQPHPAHILIIHEVGSIHYQCGICAEIFKGQGFIKFHRYCVPEQRRGPHKCRECGEEFTEKSALECHKTSHIVPNKLPHSCPICGDSFSCRAKLNKHMTSYPCAVTTFPCPYCEDTFPTEETVSDHLTQIHSEECPTFPDSRRQSKSVRSTNLQSVHLEVESQQNGDNISRRQNDNVEQLDYNRRCSNCQTTKTTLWRHDKAGEIVCNSCGLYYVVRGVKRPLSLGVAPIRRRIRKKKDPSINYKDVIEIRNEVEAENESHPQVHACPLCPKEFISEVGLRRHLRLHTTRQSDSSENGASASNDDSSSSTIFDAGMSGKEVGVKSLSTSIIPARPFECPVCGNAFGTWDLLKKHRAYARHEL